MSNNNNSNNSSGAAGGTIVTSAAPIGGTVITTTGWISIGTTFASDGYAISGDLTGFYPMPVVAKKKKESNGCHCKKCKEFFPYAESNQEDGTLICYGCRVRW